MRVMVARLEAASRCGTSGINDTTNCHASSYKTSTLASLLLHLPTQTGLCQSLTPSQVLPVCLLPHRSRASGLLARCFTSARPGSHSPFFILHTPSLSTPPTSLALPAPSQHASAQLFLHYYSSDKLFGLWTPDTTKHLRATRKILQSLMLRNKSCSSEPKITPTTKE